MSSFIGGFAMPVNLPVNRVCLRYRQLVCLAGLLRGVGD